MKTYTDPIRYRLSRLLTDVQQSLPGNVHPEVGERLNEARSTFVRGFQEALTTPPAEVPSLFQALPFHKVGFALEGAAMAMVMLDELGGSKAENFGALLNGRTEAEQVLCAIGIGLASARLNKAYHWLPAELGPHFRPLVVDGYGFHQGFFNRYRFGSKGLPSSAGELNAHYDIGLGRALWFSHYGRVEPIVQDIGKMPLDRKIHLWQGIGTACAFTGNQEHVSTAINAVPEFETFINTGLNTGLQLLHALANPGRNDIYIMKNYYNQMSL